MIGVREGFDTRCICDHLQQVVCRGVVGNLNMHCIQQVHRNGAQGQGLRCYLVQHRLDLFPVWEKQVWIFSYRGRMEHILPVYISAENQKPIHVA